MEFHGFCHLSNFQNFKYLWCFKRKIFNLVTSSFLYFLKICSIITETGFTLYLVVLIANTCQLKTWLLTDLTGKTDKWRKLETFPAKFVFSEKFPIQAGKFLRVLLYFRVKILNCFFLNLFQKHLKSHQSLFKPQNYTLCIHSK